MTVLVTGGMGLIGCNVVRRLVAQGDRVVILDRVAPRPSERSPLSDVASDVKFVEGTVTDLGVLLRLLQSENVGEVVHMAAVMTTAASLRPIEALEVNIIGTANVLEAARILGLRRVLVMSSSGVMGAPEDLVTPRKEEEIVLPATGIYPLSKLTIEQLANTYRELYMVDTAALRPRTVYGPGVSRNENPMPVTRLVEQACQGEEIVLESGSDTQFDLTYVKDEAQGIVKALKHEQPLANYVYNISYGQNVSMGAVIECLHKEFPGLRMEVGPGLWPGVLARGVQGDLTYRSSLRPPQDISKARRDFGFDPTWPVPRAIPDYINWILSGEYGAID